MGGFNVSKLLLVLTPTQGRLFQLLLEGVVGMGDPEAFGNDPWSSFQEIFTEQRILVLSESVWPPQSKMGTWLSQVRKRK